jgi:hypothetical protein
MRKATLWITGLLLLTASALAADPCSPSPTTLCLNTSRFRVEVSWRDSRDRTGVGQAVPITADTGYFWFFSESNIELVVKVLDARAVNGKYWVFFGALSSVQYDLKVTDTTSGASKTYHNPLGQFASVGDTAAFDPGPGVRAAEEMVKVEGTFSPPASLEAVQNFIDIASPASTAFTPCRTAANTLGLNSCRFALSVEWTDSHGRTGRGVPVRLTNDTGYFWFFSPSNVELMVKVLDARPVNGSFWVFYGALSNVRYDLIVADTLTGVVRRYRNPAGAFASAGDTAAFHAGRSVGPVPDTGREAVADIDSAGGSISATAADGTRFVLDLPPNALGTQTSIHMTPLSRVDGLPFSRGFIGGVRIEPEGLRLFVPARLRITPGAPLRPGAVAFSYAGNGEDFALDLSKRSGEELELQVLHFSGYGSGNATSGNVTSQASYVPLDVIQAIRQQIASILDRSVSHQDEDGNDVPPDISREEAYQQIVEILVDAFDRYITPALASLTPECNSNDIEAVANLTLSTIRGIEFLGIDDSRIDVLIQGSIDDLVDILRHCLDKAHDDCVAFKDPFKAWDMVLIERQLELFGVDVGGVLDTGGPVERCLRFRLEFDSKMTENVYTAAMTRTVRAAFPLRIDPTVSIRDVAWTGSGSTDWVSINYDTPDCTADFQTSPGLFDVHSSSKFALIFPLALARGKAVDPTTTRVRMVYDPGQPTDAEHVSCHNGAQQFWNPSLSVWWLDFEFLHGGEFLANPGGGGVGFLVDDWEIVGIGDLYAEKSWQRAKEATGGVTGTVSEDTTIRIRHTPDQ